MVEAKTHDVIPKSNVGTITFELVDHGAFVQGGVMAGSILLNLTEDVRAKFVQLAIYGVEESAFTVNPPAD